MTSRSPINRPITVPVLECLVAALLFGASTPISKPLLDSVGPLTLAGLFYLGAAVAVAPWAWRSRAPELWRDRRQLLLLAGAVLFGGCLGPVLLLLGLRLAPAASVSLWLNLETAATSILAWSLFREHLDRRTWLAAGLVFLGGLLLVSPGGPAGVRAGLFVMLACFCWGLDNNMTALVSGFTPSQTTFVKGLVAGLVNLSLGQTFETRLEMGPVVGVALVVGALSYGVSIMLYISGAQQLGASRSQLLFSTSPFLGMILAWTFLHESVQPVQLLAAVVMVAGLYLMLTARHEHEHTHESLSHTHGHRHDDGHHDHVHPGLPASTRHTHPHDHGPMTHRHPHVPDLHHRHTH
jgi:drug/metabolite transporter (DMT)-like permease